MEQVIYMCPGEWVGSDYSLAIIDPDTGVGVDMLTNEPVALALDPADGVTWIKMGWGE